MAKYICLKAAIIETHMLQFAIAMPPKKTDRTESRVNRVTSSLSPAAFRRLAYLSELLGVQPGTEAGRAIEEWIFSDDYDNRLKKAEMDAQRFADRQN